MIYNAQVHYGPPFGVHDRTERSPSVAWNTFRKLVHFGCVEMIKNKVMMEKWAFRAS